MRVYPKLRINAVRGFTLIELMVAVAITVIVAAVALPSFLSQLKSSRRIDAVEALTALQQGQERWRGVQPSYAASLGALGLSATSKSGDYSLALSDVTASGYTARATAVADRRQAGDTACATLTLSVASGTISTTPATCWRR